MQEDSVPIFAAKEPARAEPPPPRSAAQLQATGLLMNIQAVAAGGGHTCALTTTGGVKCWGWNDYGQLGDGTTEDHLAPVDVLSLTSSVQAITVGDNHTCALTTSGGVKCWGWNNYGQLGDGTTTDRLTPVNVIGLTSGVEALSAGVSHTCALTTGGGVKCWGLNRYGQLGDSTETNRLGPVDVTGLASGVQAIDAGGYHTCALTTNSGAKCWGTNGYGELGDGGWTSRLAPVDVTGLASGVQALAAGGGHTCALTTGGGVKCWGWNHYGQLGDGTVTSRPAPVDVTGLTSNVQALATGGDHTCALTTAGGVKCWGRNHSGQVGDGTRTSRLTPVNVTGLSSGVQMLTAGGGSIADDSHTCALTTAGGVKCWGWNYYGQLGDGATTIRLAPVELTSLTSSVRALATRNDHTCALTAGSGVKCWGWNNRGQLGDGTSTERFAPVDVSGLASGVEDVAVGDNHTCALTTSGGVKCWGNNEHAQLGDGTQTDRLAPVNVTGLASGVQAVVAGDNHTCVLTTGGGVKCWGNNEHGQLGDGTQTDRLAPVNVTGLASGVQALAAGGDHTCALTTSGGVKCWGYNGSGRLGDGTWTDRLTPVDVTGLTSGVQTVAAAYSHTCALTTSGGVKCWGDNGQGQLGDGTRTEHETPVDVTGLTSGAQAVATGRHHTCALTIGGGAKCWGWNGYGQLGDGTVASRLAAVDVTGLTSSVQALAAGNVHTCAVTTGGGVKCWGHNDYGQLGVNPGWLPVDVIDPNAPLTDAADLESQMPFPTVAPGTTLQLWINVRNTGDSTWQATSSYGWRGTGGWEGQTGVIAGTVAPGQIWAFTRDIVAPAEPGKHVYGFVLQHNGTDFGPHFFIEVTVNSSAALPNFQVAEHGYSFVNGLAYTPLLFGQTVYSMFGDSACWQSVGPACVLRPEIARWANLAALSSWGGQCNGMSITGLRFYQKLDQPSALQPSATRAHDLSNLTPAVPQHIMSYQIRWAIPEVQRHLAATWDDSIEQTLAAVEQGFAADAEPLVLYISSATGAHALVPYRVERLDVDDARIYVYDSNYPDDATRYVAVKPKSGIWQYEFSPGNIWNQSLYAYPAAAFAGPLPWEQPTVTSSADDVRNADTVLVSASPGLELRSAGGAPLNRLLVPTGAPGPAPSVYFLPNAPAHDVIVDRTGVTGAEGSLVYIGQVGLAAIDGLERAPISDTLTLNSAAGSLVYAPGAASTLTVTLSASNAVKDVLVTANHIRLGTQSVITAAVATEQMSVALGGANPSMYNVTMLVYSAEGVNQQFAATDVSITPGLAQLIGIPTQIGASVPITTVVVETGATTSGTLRNELAGGDNLFLPMIVR